MSLVAFINTLSAHEQFESIDSVEQALHSLVGCFDLVRPGLQAGTISLIYDESMERRGLRRGSASLVACLGAVSQRDLRVRWYLFTKNRATRVGSDCSEFELRAQGENVAGEASPRIVAEHFLFGFGGSPACEAESVELCDVVNGTAVTRVSFFEPLRLARALPRYEPNPKHRPEPYIRAGGEYVSPMTVSDVDAQHALLASLEDGVGHRFGIFEGKLLKFVLTDPRADAGTVFHAFEVGEDEVPGPLLSRLRARSFQGG